MNYKFGRSYNYKQKLVFICSMPLTKLNVVARRYYAQHCSYMFRVGQNHTFIGIYGVHTEFLAGKSSYIRSYTVHIYGSGQPYTGSIGIHDVPFNAPYTASRPCDAHIAYFRVGQNRTYTVYKVFLYSIFGRETTTCAVIYSVIYRYTVLADPLDSNVTLPCRTLPTLKTPVGKLRNMRSNTVSYK